jgi:cytochrome c oxidase subunit 4
MSTHTADLHHGDAVEHEHPGERTYIRIAVILAIITIIEVAIYYIEALDDILVPALLIMSVVKFLFVVSYFMHLKFDDRRLAWVFGSAMIVALSVVIALDVLGHVHGIDYASNLLTGDH